LSERYASLPAETMMYAGRLEFEDNKLSSVTYSRRPRSVFTYTATVLYNNMT